jgi:Cu-Zn family superoxide dismutase
MRQRIDGQAVQRAIVVAAVSLLGGLSLSGCAGIFGPHEKRADAQLLPTMGNSARGTVTFIERSDGVQVTYNLSGLPPNGDHALQIHERGDCNAGDGSSAGSLFAPAADELKSGVRVEGDLGNIHADANGGATGFVVAPDVSLDGVRSILSRSVLIHRDPSDPYAFASHGAGPALSCGLIRQ